MMTKMKRPAAILLALVMLFALMPMTASAASAQYTFRISGTFDYEDAAEVLLRLNAQRARAGAGPLVMDERLMEAAMQRAAELPIYWDHTRPDGSSCFTVITWPTGRMGENLAMGYPNAASVMEGWTNSKGHHDNMMHPDYNAVGIASFYQANGRKCWVQLFATQSITPSAKTGRQTLTKYVTARSSVLNISASRASASIQVGGSVALELYNTNGDFGTAKILPSYYESSDTRVAAIDSNGNVTGIANGTATVRLGVGADYYREVSITVGTGVFAPPQQPTATPEPTPAAPPDMTAINNFVTRLYRTILEREPESKGLSDWVTGLANRTITGAEAAYGFVFSPEMIRKNLSNSDFVEIMYNSMLGRSSDETGKAGWVNLLNSGYPRENIFEGFVMSTEFGNLCRAAGILRGTYVPQPKTEVYDFVARLYSLCLARQPDRVGLASWVDALAAGQMTGSQVGYNFVFSSEMNRKNLTNEQFVDMLYRAFLGREPDAAGRAGWVSHLGSGGQGRELVFYGFAGSNEFSEICARYGIRR